jgi:hypothetical protein
VTISKKCNGWEKEREVLIMVISEGRADQAGSEQKQEINQSQKKERAIKHRKTKSRECLFKGK